MKMRIELSREEIRDILSEYVRQKYATPVMRVVSVDIESYGASHISLEESLFVTPEGGEE